MNKIFVFLIFIGMNNIMLGSQESSKDQNKQISDVTLSIKNATEQSQMPSVRQRLTHKAKAAAYLDVAVVSYGSSCYACQEFGSVIDTDQSFYKNPMSYDSATHIAKVCCYFTMAMGCCCLVLPPLVMVRRHVLSASSPKNDTAMTRD